MHTSHKPLFSLTAADVMTSPVVQLPQYLALRDAVAVLFEHRCSGAPIVDWQGKCVGVITTTDLANQAREHGAEALPSDPITMACEHQRMLVGPDTRQVVHCALEEGSCPFQEAKATPEGEKILLCKEPTTVCVDWQIVELSQLPEAHVAEYMNREPITVKPETSLARLAQLMIEAHVHRLVVVDEQEKPVGIVSPFDILTAVVRSAQWECE